MPSTQIKVAFPLNYVETISHTGKKIIKPKHPAIREWQKITESVPIYPNQGTGIPCGEINNITVLDFDDINQYQTFVQKFPKILETQIVQTPSGGYHVYFNYENTLNTTSFKQGVLAGIDIRNDRGFIISPPSYQIDLETGIRKEYKIINQNRRIDIPDEVIEYILSNSHQDSSKKHYNKEYEYNDTVYFCPNLDIIKQALDKIDNGDKWRQVTNAIKGLMNSENSEELISIWDKWSYGHQTYNKEENMKIFNAEKHAIHPNYIFKLAKMNRRIFARPYTEPEIKFDYIFNEQYVANGMKKIPPEIMDKDYAAKSGTGSGKTYHVAQQIKTRYMKKRVYVITNRVSLSKQHLKSFEASKFKHYQDKDMIVQHAMTNYINQTSNAKLIVQINSLCKIGDIPTGGIVILDEVSSLLKYLVSGNISKLERVYIKFCDMIQKAEQVICIDGDLDQYSIDFINTLRSSPMILIRNEYKNATGIKCTITQNISQVYQILKDKLDQGWLTVHCADTKSMIKEINKKLNSFGILDKQIKSYHTDSKEDKNDLADVNTTWNGKHVTFSPSIVTGVDYTFDTRTVFLYVNASGQTFGKYKTITARDMAQQIARVRSIDELVVYLDTRASRPEFSNFEDFKNDFLNTVVENNSHLSSLITTISDKHEIALKENRFTELLLRYRFEDMMIQSDQENYLVDRLKQKGFDLFFLNEPKEAVKPLGCEHANIDEYIEIFKHPEKNIPTPNTVLLENIKKRLEILHLNFYGLNENGGISDNVKNLVACGRSVRHYLNYNSITKKYYRFEPVNLVSLGTDKHKIEIIRSLLDKQKLTIQDLSKPEVQFLEPLYTLDDMKVFKKSFEIKNRTDYVKNYNKFITKLAKSINELTFFCSSFGDCAQLFDIGKEQSRITGGRLKGKHYYPIKLNKKYLEFIDEVKGKPEVDDPMNEIVLENGICMLD